MAEKLTKREIINSMLAEESIAKNSTYKAFLEHEIELLNKKSERKKPTKAQEANAEIKEIILEALKNMSGTVTEIQKVSPNLEGCSNQKISALLKQLVESGKVTKTIDKKKSIFSLAEAGVVGE